MSKIKKFLLSTTSFLAITSQVDAAEFNLRMQAMMPAGSEAYAAFERFAERVNVMSGDRLKVQTMPEAAVVSGTEMLNAVSNGILDGQLGSIAYNAGKDPAFGVLGNFVAGYNTPEQLQAFFETGGGNEIAQDLYKEYGVCFIGPVFWQPESIPSNKPINGVEDLKGLKIRAPEGTVAHTFSALGASVVNLPGSEIFQALSSGIIDATDYTTLGQNLQVGLHQTSKYALFPFNHSMPALDISLNCNAWESLPNDIQEIFKTSTQILSYDLIQATWLTDMDAAKSAKEQGVTLIDWSQEERKKLRSAASTVMQEYSNGSEMAKRAFEAHKAFMSKVGLL